MNARFLGIVYAYGYAKNLTDVRYESLIARQRDTIIMCRVLHG